MPPVFPSIMRLTAGRFRVAFVIALFSICTSFADAKVDLKAQFGFGGWFVPGDWTRARVLISNKPDPKKPDEKLGDIDATIRITVNDLEGREIRYEREVSLPRNSQKVVELTVQFPHRTDPIRVDVLSRKGRVLLRKSYDLKEQIIRAPRTEVNVRPLVLIEQDATGAVAIPSEALEGVERKGILLDELPTDARAYASVRMLVIRHRISNRLREDQLQALDQWIRQGGKLVVVTPRAVSEIALDDWLLERMPAIPDGADEALIQDFEPSNNPALADQKALITRWDEIKPDARVLWATPRGPMALEKKLGAGSVIAFATWIDSRSMGLTSNATEIGRQMISVISAAAHTEAREDVRARHYWSTENIDPEFTGVTMLPNLLIVVGLLVLFVVAVGPLNFYVLRKRNRLELAWFTIPALSIFFFSLVYFYGAAKKGNDHYLATAEILHLQSGDPNGLLLWSGAQFSPRKTIYRFDAPDGGVAQTFTELYVPASRGGYGMIPSVLGGGGSAVEAGPATISTKPTEGADLAQAVSQWVLGFFQGEERVAIDGVIEGYVELGAGAPRLVLKNETEATLTAGVLAIGELLYVIDEIPAGGSVDKKLTDQEAEVTYKNAEAPSAFGTDVSSRYGSTVRLNELLQREELQITDKFTQSAFKRILTGSFESYPVLAEHAPQRRVRLMALQDTWESQLEVSPRPDFRKSASLIEIGLPVRLVGTNTFSTVKGKGGSTLHINVIDGKADGSDFFHQTQAFASLHDSEVTVAIAPPDIEGEAYFVNGNINMSYTLFTDELQVEVFDYARGTWVEAHRQEAATSRPQEANIGIRREWVNPVSRSVRFKIQTTKLEDARVNQFGGGYGAHIMRIDANMTFTNTSRTRTVAR